MVSQVKLYSIEGKVSLLTEVNGSTGQYTEIDKDTVSEIIKFLSNTEESRSLTLQRYGNESSSLVQDQFEAIPRRT
jgi:hypothetical protein